MKIIIWLTTSLLVQLIPGVSAFAGSKRLALSPTNQRIIRSHRPQSSLPSVTTTASSASSTTTTTTLYAEKKDDKKSSAGLDENVKNRLLAESIAPWRAVRLFLYFSLGSGALIGGIITLTGLLAALSNGREDFSLNTELLNLGIDFGAVAIFAALAKWDSGKQGELQAELDEKIARKKEQNKAMRTMREREQTLLRSLQLELRIAASETRRATVGELQQGARQHIILVAGPKKACRDALIGANLLKMDFAMSNVLVVPYETDVDEVEMQSRPTGSGFGDQATYETQPYVARPTGDGWEDFINAEVSDAVEQNGPQVMEEGIVLVIANTGTVIKRGVGKVPWRQMVEQLEAKVAET